MKMESHEVLNIKVNKDDIFEYVVGNSQYCPIERLIDNKRYATYDEFIYDSKEKAVVDQLQDYKNFSIQVSLLRGRASKMSTVEINQICLELQEIAPKTINL